jgi:hypothetical protein
METRKIFAILSCLVLACLVYLPAAKADTNNEKTKIVFDRPVEIPGRILPAGTYWFVLRDDNSDRNIVEVFNSDWKLDATVFAVSTQRNQPTAYTEIKFAERPHDKPEALLDWYYPGRLGGHEFVYSARHEKEFTRDAKREVVARPTTFATRASATTSAGL